MTQQLFTVRPNQDSAKESLLDRISSEKDALKQDLLKNGAVLFRGYDIKTPEDFEDIALALEPGLHNNYAGTSPRNSRTKFVHSASELPAFYPITQHCEMSFLPTAPRYLFFFCYVEPKDGGETPICASASVPRETLPCVLRALQTVVFSSPVSLWLLPSCSPYD